MIHLMSFEGSPPQRQKPSLNLIFEPSAEGRSDDHRLDRRWTQGVDDPKLFLELGMSGQLDCQKVAVDGGTVHLSGRDHPQSPGMAG